MILPTFWSCWRVGPLSSRIHCYVPKTGFTACREMKWDHLSHTWFTIWVFTPCVGRCLCVWATSCSRKSTGWLWSWGMHVPHGPCIWHWHRSVHRRHHTLLTAPGKHAGKNTHRFKVKKSRNILRCKMTETRTQRNSWKLNQICELKPPHSPHRHTC